ncbi:MAG: OmpA family protein [Maritimibacter sp.]|nr:OmpA family protein [Maritimibacter sp.]
MQAKLLKLGTALTAAAAFLNATTAPAAAGGYYDNAALINHYIQQAPWTGYGSGYDYGWKSYGSGWTDYDYGWKSWDYVPHKTHYSSGWTPKYDYPSYHYPSYDWPSSYVSTLGHGTVTYYDHYGDPVYYGDPAYAKRATIVHPKVVYDDYGYGHVYDDDYGDYGVHDGYGDDHVMHVGKHATDIRNPVFFASGSSMLDYEAKHELKQIGQIVSAYYFSDPKVLILLSGFTDATGSQSANEALAKARNHAVKDFLVAEFGFDPARFVLRAVGEEYANASGHPYDENQRKVTVSLVGLPKSATDEGHPHHEPAMAESHPMTEPTGLDKGELAPVEEHAMVAPEPAMKPMPKPVYEAQMTEAEMAGSKGYVAEMAPAYAAPVKTVTRCYVPSGPYAGHYVDGKLLATLFTSIDDYGGGKLEEVCGLRY